MLTHHIFYANAFFIGDASFGLAATGVIFMRKSHYVKTVNHKDICFLNALRCSGICTKGQATKFISTNRLKNFVLDRTLEKCSYISQRGIRSEIYRISEQGKNWIRQHIEILADRKYYSSTGTEHDICLMNKIISLSADERASMRCEAEIRDEFRERLDYYQKTHEYDRYENLYAAMQEHTISMPDLGYGTNEYYEVVTQSYTEEAIIAKIEAVEIVGGSLTMERI